LKKSLYDKHKKKVMSCLSSVEIHSLLSQYQKSEYSELQLVPLCQHLFASICRELVLAAFGIGLAWEESDIPLLSYIVDTFRLFVTRANNRQSTNMSPEITDFLCYCCGVKKLEEINDDEFDDGVDFALKILGGLLSEIMTIQLGMSWIEQDGAFYLSKGSTSCQPTVLVFQYVSNHTDTNLVSFYLSIKDLLRNPIIVENSTDLVG
jgi:hypothetical protein